MKTWGLTEEQKASRRKYLGGSDAGSIVAGGEAWLNLWRIKTGRAKSIDLSSELRVMMGLATEEFNKYWYEQRTGRLVERCQVFQRHPTIPFMGARLDGVSLTSHGHSCTWQAKHVGKSGEQMELRYTSQCHHEALCCNVDWYVLSTFISNNKWELLEAEVDPLFASDYLAKCRAFWAYVEADEEPPEVEPLPVPRPRQLRVVELDNLDRDGVPNWAGEMVRQIRTFAETKSTADLHAATREKIKDLVPDDVGEIKCGLFTLKRIRNGIKMTLGKLE